MLISLYTLPNCDDSKQTRVALTSAGIAFTERSAADQSPLEAPVITMIVNNEIVAWRGHRPDLLELLADLIDVGPVTAHGLQDRDHARDAVLTRMQVNGQIEGHQVSVSDFFDECGNHPLYRGAVVLDWLGY